MYDSFILDYLKSIEEESNLNISSKIMITTQTLTDEKGPLRHISVLQTLVDELGLTDVLKGDDFTVRVP